MRLGYTSSSITRGAFRSGLDPSLVAVARFEFYFPLGFDPLSDGLRVGSNPPQTLVLRLNGGLMPFHQLQQQRNKTFKGKPDKKRRTGVVSLVAGGGEGQEDPRGRPSRPTGQGGERP